jgi:hypothetical protein
MITLLLSFAMFFIGAMALRADHWTAGIFLYSSINFYIEYRANRIEDLIEGAKK